MCTIAAYMGTEELHAGCNATAHLAVVEYAQCVSTPWRATPVPADVSAAKATLLHAFSKCTCFVGDTWMLAFRASSSLLSRGLQDNTTLPCSALMFV